MDPVQAVIAIDYKGAPRIKIGQDQLEVTFTVYSADPTTWLNAHLEETLFEIKPVTE